MRPSQNLSKRARNTNTDCTGVALAVLVVNKERHKGCTSLVLFIQHVEVTVASEHVCIVHPSVYVIGGGSPGRVVHTLSSSVFAA